MDSRRLGLFLAVVDEGTFTAAARAVHLSQPALSQAIGELEREVGVELFQRIGRRVTLTAAGAALVEPARQTQRDLANARAAVAAVAGLDAGHLDLVALPTLAVEPVARIVGDFRRAHPAVTIRLADPDDPAEVVRIIRSGAAELGITDAPATPTGLVQTRLADLQVVLAFPPGRVKPPSPFPLRELHGTPMITTPPGTASRRLLDDACARARVTPTIAVETEQREAILPLVLAGAGAALIPEALGETARGSGAHVVPCHPSLQRRIALLHRDATLSPAATQFRATAVGRFIS